MSAPIAIRAEASPADPDTVRFVVDRPVSLAPVLFDHAPAGAPLAAALFDVDGVRRVQIDGPVLTISRRPGADWAAVKPAVAAAIRRVLPEAGPIEATCAAPPGQRDARAVLAAVQAALDAEVNPTIASHGGRVDALAVEDGAVLVRMSGGCQGCAASTATLRGGVEKTVRAVAPEIRRIVDVTDHDAGTMPYFARGQAGPSPLAAAALPPDAVRREGDSWTVDAGHLAPRLGLDADTLRAEMRAGRVASREERGEGGDEGFTRLTVRWRQRLWRALVGPDGRATEIAPDPEERLSERVRTHLAALPEAILPMTYGDLAEALEVTPPHAIGRVARALETTMRQDAEAGRPFVAALVVGRARGGIPAKGYFDLALALGRGPAPGENERAHHAREMAAALAARRGG